MSRLRTPEVEVIRFNEADVIVASGTLRLTNFTDSEPKNATGVYKGYTYVNDGSGDINAFISYINQDHPGDINVDNANGMSGNIGFVFLNEETQTDYDGIYTWSDGRFVRTTRFQ
ncbi:hypothetical protein [uncultured Ruminococcus sp.]|uniref:hypothetical protein n=1 Tax=uncultured Ruminococcus sp. TaxID=165186 RepID=UPI0025DB9A6D|nr:hypothetical protein [uncultured Ruminococcus sp.]